jgi:hypothetical protein
VQQPLLIGQLRTVEQSLYRMIAEGVEMRYVDFRDSTREALLQNPEGLTWVQLKEMLELPYQRPCPTWTKRMAQEDGLYRTRGQGRAFVWKIGPEAKL